MLDIVSPLFQWLNTHPQLAGLVTFIISAGESVALIGTIVPGSIMMTALGMLAGAGIIPLWSTILWAIAGAIVGDGISYWIGHYFKDRLPNIWPFYKYPGILKTGEIFFYKYGSMSVFIGRFVGPVRALVPLVAGMLGLAPWKFTIANILSAIGWAPAYMLPGIALGAASLELPPDIAIHVMLVLLLLGLFVLLCMWFIYKLLQLIQNRIDQIQNTTWQRLKQSRYFSALTVLLQYHDSTQPPGQLNLAIYFIFTSILFVCLALYVKVIGPNHIFINQIMFHFFRGIRSDNFDNVMLNITLLGQKEVILPIFIVLFVFLTFFHRPRAALHGLSLGILAAGSIFLIKNIMKLPRPWGIFKSPESFSMPSGHAVLSTITFLWLAFLIANAITAKRRWIAYIVALVFIITISISRLYLDAHWTTDIVSGWLLAAALLLFIVISYRRHAEKAVQPLAVLLISIITLTCSFSIYHYLNYSTLQSAYKQINWPSIEISMQTWWKKEDHLPALRTSLFGFPTQFINVEWTGDLAKIKQTLLSEGWTNPPARDWISSLHRIADVRSTQYLPMVSPQYLDQKPALILTRQSRNKNNLLVLRLWKANVTIKETHTPLWVGTLALVPSTYSWLSKRKSQQSRTYVDTNLVQHLFPIQLQKNQWQWHIMIMSHLVKNNKIIERKIILIRHPTGIFNNVSL